MSRGIAAFVVLGLAFSIAIDCLFPTSAPPTVARRISDVRLIMRGPSRANTTGTELLLIGYGVC